MVLFRLRLRGLVSELMVLCEGIRRSGAVFLPEIVDGPKELAMAQEVI